MRSKKITSFKYALDSYAWIEYAIGSTMGEFVKEVLELAICFTPSIVIAELSFKFTNEQNVEDWLKLLKFIKVKTQTVPLDESLSNKSGEQKFFLRKLEKKIGLSDAIIYQTSISIGARLISGDDHFKNIPNVIFLKNVQIIEKELQLLKKK